MTSLVIQRGGPPGPVTVARFDVPDSPGQTVLDALRYIRVHVDPTLAFRFSCINANACKECMMLIDGKVDYACTTRLRPGEMTLAPLPKKALINDLVTEIGPPDERLIRRKPATKPR
jgi:succinate dehydrogenase/fumarate reductase-like Fe-S protein